MARIKFFNKETNRWEYADSIVGGGASEEQIEAVVEAYLAENPVESVVVDTTLTRAGQAADAKAVGNALAGKQEAGSYVKKVNGTAPDAEGNLTLEGVTVSDDQVTAAVEAYFQDNPIKIPNAVLTVNGISPDLSGNVDVSGLPSVTADDAGKFLRVNAEGDWAIEAIPSAEGVSF